MKFNNKEKKKILKAKQLSKQLASNLPKKIKAASLSLSSKLPFKAVSLREVLIHRIAELSEVAVELFELKKIVPAIIMTRAVFETTAVLYWLYKSIKQVCATKELGNIDEFFMKSLFGSKDEERLPESYNILTAINHTDKDSQGYRNAYNSLSEFAHPNWSGLSGAYSKLNREKIILELGKELGNIPLSVALPLLLGALTLFIDYYNEMETYLLQFNEICDKICQNTNKDVE